LGTRYTGAAALVSITVDGSAAGTVNLRIPGEDVLIRWPVGQYSAGSHTIVATHAGPANAEFWFDFVEAAVPTTMLPTFPVEPQMTLATDWDTNHSLALAPERTAWLMDTLGFTARTNHYVGALWFYELARPGQEYAAGTVTFAGPADSDPSVTYSVTLTLGRTDEAGTTVLTKLIHMGDTQETLAVAFTNELNRGYMSFRGSVSGNVLTIYSRSMGLDGNFLSVAATTTSPDFTLNITGTLTSGIYTLAGGVDGAWLTDLTATPRLNRAVRDWTTSFFAALHGYGIDTTGSLSMELQYGDTSVAAGIAQRGPLGDPVVLPTPSVQTNFSPASLAFWQEAYAEIAAIQASVGLQPFVQFGEAQWWYSPTNGLPLGEGRVDYYGMPFYDAWTQSQFLAEFGHPMDVITTNTVDPADYPDEVSFLPVLIGNFTSAIISYVLASYPTCRFEVLYPGDVNQTAFNQAINFPAAAWTEATLTVLKTEGFGFTLGRDLDSSEGVIDSAHGFPATQRSHLVGIGDSTTAWVKEARSAAGKGFESVVLFALDQFCLIGYPVPLQASLRRSLRMGR
jgi:hypothetical protein